MDRRISRAECPHAEKRDAGAEPRGNACEVCGETWETRVCATCGFVGCCESSKGHDTEHWKNEGHPIIRRFKDGKETWTWCYACNAYLE